jgi:hypothetical protein
MKGVAAMSGLSAEPKRLDMNKLNSLITKIVPIEEALKDVTPLEWSDEVLSGVKKVVITNAENYCENKCVKLKISYL